MEKKIGHWIKDMDCTTFYTCSECGMEVCVTRPQMLKEKWKFCPSCGKEVEYQEPEVERSKTVFVERKVQMEVEWSTLKVGDRIGDFVVIGRDGNIAYIQQCYNIKEMAYDSLNDKKASDLTYENSEIKKYLKEDYASDYDDQKLMQELELRRISEWDLLRVEDLRLDETKYEYYTNLNNYTKYNEDGEATWWWLQDVSIANFPRFCSTSGAVSYDGADYAIGLAPACAIEA